MPEIVRVSPVMPFEHDEPGRPAAPSLAVDGFYSIEYAPVVRLAFALTGRLAVAEEMAQDAFLAAFRNWDRIAASDQPGAWVRRVVTHRSTEQLGAAGKDLLRAQGTADDRFAGL